MSAAIPIVRHKLTVADYHRMAEVGILAANARVELIEGEIFDMAPIGSKHGSVVDKLTRLLVRAVGDHAIVRVQGSIRLNRHTEPQPDIALLKYRADFYESTIPSAGDVALLIEVADSTLVYDRDVKAPLYALAGIPEYWLFDLDNRQIVFHCQPIDGQYRSITSAATPGITSVRAFENIAVDLNGLV